MPWAVATMKMGDLSLGLLRKIRLSGACCAVLLLVGAEPALASGFYHEFGGGTGFFMSSQSNFGSRASGTVGPGASFYAAPGFNFSSLGALIQMHASVQVRAAMITASKKSFGMMSLYPAFRVELGRKAYIGVGATPLSYIRSASDAGFDGYKIPSGAIAVLGEVGMQWLITPRFFVNVSAVGQLLRTSSGFGPAPSIDGVVSVRWYWAVFGANLENEREKWNRWRYPQYF